MKRIYLATLLTAVSLSSPLALADGAHHADTGKRSATAMTENDKQMQMGRMQETMLRMHEQMHRIMEARNPQEREHLMKEHAKMMQDHMQMMQGMMGGGMMGHGRM